MPSGNEPGANENWLPGGYTSGGAEQITTPVSAEILQMLGIISGYWGLQNDKRRIIKKN